MSWLIQTDIKEYNKGNAQLRAYSAAVSEQGKGHNLGPPGLAAFGGVLAALRERGNEVGASSAKTIETFGAIWDELEAEAAFDMVPHCRLAKVYDSTQCRLELVVTNMDYRSAIRDALSQTGAKRLLGQAPSGALEQAIQKALEEMQGQ